MPYIGQGLTEGRRRVYNFVATSNQTTFTATYDVGYIDVYQNGILLTSTDYTATNGTTVVLAVGASSGDEITIIAHQIFSVTDTVSAITGGAFGGNVDVTGNITTTGSLRGPSTFTIDPAVHGANSGTVVIAGDLQVDGTTTTINSTTLDIDDKNIVFASGSANSSAAGGAGITIDLGSDGTATMLYTHATTSLDFNKPVNIAGNLGVTGTVDGVDIATRDAVLTSTTTTANAALPKAGGTMSGALTVSSRVGVNQTPASNNYTLQVTGLATNGTDGRAVLVKGNSASTTIGGAGPSIAIQNTNSTANNVTKLSFETASAGEAVSINAINTNHSSFYGDLAINTRGAGGYSEKMRVMADGNVGIGDPVPQDFLEVRGTSLGGITISNSNHNQAALSFARSSTATARIFTSEPNALHTSKMHFQTSDASGSIPNLITRMVIDDSGNVGIGTTSPSFPLSVQSNSNAEALLILGRSSDDIGEIAFRENDNSTALGELQYRQDHAILRHRVGDLRFATGGTTERMRIDSNGTIGINATPNANWSSVFDGRIDVGGGGLVVGNEEAVHIGVNWYYDGSAYRYRNTGTASSMYHHQGNTVFQNVPSGSAGSTFGWVERMRIASGGNVGIGTTNPGSKLQVDHGTTAQYASSIRNTADNLQLLLGTTTGGLLNIQGKTISSNATYEIALQAEGGKVGIGTASPNRLLHVSGTGNVYGKFESRDATGAGIQVKDSAEDFLIQADGAGVGGLAIYDLGRTTYRWRINSSGVTIPQRVQPVYYEPQIKYHAVTGGFRGGSASANTWYSITNQNINGYNNSYADGARGVNFMIKWTSGNVNRGYHHTVSGHIPILSANSYSGYQNGPYATATSGTSASAGLNINITHHTGCLSGHNIQCRLYGDGINYGSIFLQIKAEAPPAGNDCQISFWKV